MNLFLDIETTGLPDRTFNWRKDFMQYPHIVSIAWKYQNNVNHHIIFQEGREIPIASTKIHGITTKMGNDRSKTTDLSLAVSMLIRDAEHASNIIGHNLYFDTSIIKANVLRQCGVVSEEAKRIEDALHLEKRLDTMRLSHRWMGGGKWPTLVELHTKLFNKGFEAHSALEDILATERCFNALRKLKVA